MSVLIVAVKSLSLSLSDGLMAFSIEANLAAGDTSPAPMAAVDVSAARGEGPVNLWTKLIKSFTVVWMTFGDTV